MLIVSGLVDHFANKNGGVSLLPHEIAVELRVSHFTAEFHLVARRGGRLSDPDYALPDDELFAAQPHFIIQNLGANDLVSIMTPFERLEIVEKVVGLARKLNSRFNVSVVMIAYRLSIAFRVCGVSNPSSSTINYIMLAIWLWFLPICVWYQILCDEGFLAKSARAIIMGWHPS